MGRLQSMSLKHKILAVILTGFLVLFLAGIVSLEFVSNSYEKKLYNSIAASLTDSALEIYDPLKMCIRDRFRTESPPGDMSSGRTDSSLQRDG